ncbi:hypothetical protein M3Y97_01167000 [Aphelenchoides bicaudatus]|nr:hypothetical protein M3Y97_01167000 [Aphelenchoides bicaudatus]
MRQMACLEYRAKHDVNTAVKNIVKVFGRYSVDSFTVQKWFTKFKKERTKKFTAKSAYKIELDKHFSTGTQVFMDGIISQVKLKFFYKAMNTFDGRIGFAVLPNEFVVADLFHGEVRSVPFSFSQRVCQPVEFIDEERFLVLEVMERKLALFKFDYDTMSIEKLDEAFLEFDMQHCYYLLLDQLELTKFVIYNQTTTVDFCAGRVIEGRIVLGGIARSEDGITLANLSGSVLQFLKPISSSMCALSEIDLETMELKITHIPTTKWTSYFWAGDFFYVAYMPSGGVWTVAVLNIKTREWFDTKIGIFHTVWKLFVDENQVLTVVAENSLTTATTFYRYSLRKPDSLVNLAWFSYTREFKSTGKRGILFNHLPYTCDVRVQLPETKDDDILIVD